jgi:hypothetical protein
MVSLVPRPFGVVVIALFSAVLALGLVATALVSGASGWPLAALGCFMAGVSARHVAVGRALKGAGPRDGTAVPARRLALMRASFAAYALSGAITIVGALLTLSRAPGLLLAFAALCWTWMEGWALWSSRG